MSMEHLVNILKQRAQQHWLEMQNCRYVPLKIVFKLGAPVALTHPWLHLDGLISHLLLLDTLGEDYYVLPTKFPINRLVRETRLPNPPIMRHKSGLYYASASIFDVDTKRVEVMYKRFEDSYAPANARKRISRGSGHFRDYAMRHVYIPATTVTFYARGVPEVLERLLSYVPGLGDNVRIGWGEVRSFSIEEISDDYSIVCGNIATRPIPVNLLKSYSDAVMLAWRPPYWANDSVGLCAPPGATVELADDFHVPKRRNKRNGSHG